MLPIGIDKLDLELELLKKLESPSDWLELNDILDEVTETDEVAVDGEDESSDVSGNTGWYDKLELNEFLYENKDEP